AEWFQKKLKKTRQTAGTVRDLDVLSNRLRSSEEQHQEPGLKSLIARVEEERRHAQPAINELRHRLKSHGFTHRRKKLVRRVAGASESKATDFLSAAQ